MAGILVLALAVCTQPTPLASFQHCYLSPGVSMLSHSLIKI